MVARTIVTSPTVEPLTLTETKDHLRVDHTDDDALIEHLITTAREHVENVTRRAINTQTWDVFFNAFAEVMELPMAPLGSVTSVKYIDLDGVQQTLSSSVYTVDSDTQPGRIYLAYNQDWPSVRDQRHAVTVRIVCGYGNTWQSVPRPIRTAMLLIIGHWYENREASIVGVSVAHLPLAVNALLAPYRLMGF